MTEDSLSNDEYECASPDDISLPPLAETPESNVVQSDIEEGCFSSHSAHTNQHSHQCHAQSEPSGTGAGPVRQQRGSSRTESCLTPPSHRHSSTRSVSRGWFQVLTPEQENRWRTEKEGENVSVFCVCSRFRSESSSFSQSPLITSTPPAHILKTSEDSVHQSAPLSMDSPELSVPAGSHQSEKNNPLDSCSRKDNVPEKKNFLPTELSSRCNQPPKSPATQVKITQSGATEGETFSQTDPIIPQSSYCPDPDLHKDKTSLHDTRFLKGGSSSAISSPQSEEEPASVSKTQRTSLTSTSTSAVTKRTVYVKSSPSLGHSTLAQASRSTSSPQEGPFSQSGTPIHPVPQVCWFAQSPNLTDSVPSKDTTQDAGTTIVPRDGSLPQKNLDSTRVFDQDVTSVSVSHNNKPTIVTVNQEPTHRESSPPFGGLPEVHAPIPSQSNLLSTIRTSRSAIIRFGSHETICTKQCVHDPGMTPSRPVSHLHDAPLSSPPHPLTPDHDANICQPVAIREEIQLTRQIRGPPLPASPAPPRAQAETLPLGKASKLGPPCFTRPLSKATVMEGAPVTLEVEVTGHPEPTLTWWVAYNQLDSNTHAS